MVAKKKTEEKIVEVREKWIYITGLDADKKPVVLGKRRVPLSYVTDDKKGEFEKYTDGARDAVVAALTKQMDVLREHRHAQYIKAAKTLKVIE